MWQGREIRNDMPVAKTFQLPSVEQMKREVETGEFSPESIAIAESILKNAENIEDAVDFRPRDEEPLDWWATQEHFGAPLSEAELANETLMRNYSDLTDHEKELLKGLPKYKREKSFIEKQTNDIMARVTKGVTPASAHFKKIETSAKKTTRAFRKLNKALPQKPAPGAKLQHRPFLILSTIRDEFTE
jgi:hypothetical protein